MDILGFIAAMVVTVQQMIAPVPVEIAKQSLPKLVIAVNTPAVGFGKLTHSVPKNVLGAQNATPSATASFDSLDPGQARKKSYIISILGDSMTDTLGQSGGGLDSKLKKLYPDATFTIKNHGVGAENIDSGIYRLTNGYRYLGIDRPSVLSEKPDIIVLESFGYNPYSFTDGALDRHWLAMADIVRKIHTEAPGTGIVIAVTISPNWNVFGDGTPLLKYSPQEKKEKVKVIKQYLESTISFAKGEHLPLADVYTPSLDPDGNGKLAFINSGDHIHYSPAGRELFGQILAASITNSELLE